MTLVIFLAGIVADLIWGTTLGFSGAYFLISGLVLEKVKGRKEILAASILVLLIVYGNIRKFF